ncbi:MAG: hypothetical protein R6T85_05985 [Egibacteraceae bacterium]
MTGRLRAGGVAAALLALMLATSFQPVAAGAEHDGGRVDAVAVHEALEATFDPDGELREATVRTALDVVGHGEVTLELPTGQGVRRIDGFAQPEPVDDGARLALDLTEPVRRDLVAEVGAEELPLLLRARYELDGRPVSAGDLAGASGEAVIRVQLRDLTAEATPLVHTVEERPIIAERDLAVPVAARLAAELDGSWSEVEVVGGSVAPQGRAGTLATWSGTLLEPLTAGEAEIEIRGVVDDAAVPTIVVEAAPLHRGDGSELAHLTELLDDRQRDDALLAFGLAGVTDGLVGLREGLGELTGGLEELEEGARELAGGVAEAAEGASGLAGGLGELGAGVDGLADGLAELAGGSRDLADGSAEYAAGVAEVDEQADLPDPDELTGGLAQLPTALDGLAAGARDLEAGAQTLADETGEAIEELDLSALAEATAALEESAEALEVIGGALAGTDEEGLTDGLDALAAELGAATAELDATIAELEAAGADEATLAALRGARETIAGAQQGVAANSEGIAAVLDDTVGQLGELALGLAEVAEGLAEVEAGPGGLAELPAAIEGLAGGVGEVAAGAEELSVGAQEAVDEIASGAAGLAELDTALGELATGAEGLAEGASGVAEGTTQSAAGAEELGAGTDELAAGGEELAGGLFEATGGSRELAGGLDGAAEGGAELTGGVRSLREEGVAPLVVQVDDASEATSLDLATLGALERRAEEDALVVGAPEGAQTSASYRLVLDAGVDARTGTATAQLVGAIALLVAIGGLEALRRRIAAV